MLETAFHRGRKRVDHDAQPDQAETDEIDAGESLVIEKHADEQVKGRRNVALRPSASALFLGNLEKLLHRVSLSTGDLDHLIVECLIDFRSSREQPEKVP